MAYGLPKHLEQPPDHLSEKARTFFLHVVESGPYDAPARALLIRYLEVGDDLERCRAELAALASTGQSAFTFTDKHNQPRMHPLRKHELQLTNEFGKLFRLLGWDQAPPEGGQLVLPFAPAK